MKVQKQPLSFLILNTKRTPVRSDYRQFVFALKSYRAGMRWNVARNVIPDVALSIQNLLPLMQFLVAWGSVLPNVLPSGKRGDCKKAAERISVGSNEEKNSRKCLNHACQFRHFLHKLAETVGFEPTDPCGSTDFELESLSGL